MCVFFHLCETRLCVLALYSISLKDLVQNHKKEQFEHKIKIISKVAEI